MMTKAYFVNGADDGTIIVYPNSDVGSTIEGFMYDAGVGAAYSSNPVQEITIEDLVKDYGENAHDYDGNNIRDAEPVDAETIKEIIELIDNCDADEVDEYDEYPDAGDVADEINSLLCDFVFVPEYEEA